VYKGTHACEMSHEKLDMMATGSYNFGNSTVTIRVSADGFVCVDDIITTMAGSVYAMSLAHYFQHSGEVIQGLALVHGITVDGLTYTAKGVTWMHPAMHHHFMAWANRRYNAHLFIFADAWAAGDWYVPIEQMPKMDEFLAQRENAEMMALVADLRHCLVMDLYTYSVDTGKATHAHALVRHIYSAWLDPMFYIQLIQRAMSWIALSGDHHERYVDAVMDKTNAADY